MQVQRYNRELEAKDSYLLPHPHLLYCLQLTSPFRAHRVVLYFEFLHSQEPLSVIIDFLIFVHNSLSHLKHIEYKGRQSLRSSVKKSHTEYLLNDELQSF